jgi:hypothetical protein
VIDPAFDQIKNGFFPIPDATSPRANGGDTGGVGVGGSNE